MLNRKQIKEILKPFLIVNCVWFNKYLDLMEEMIEHYPQSCNKYNYHHLIPVSIYKNIKGLKNRAQAINGADETFTVENNIVKLPIYYHVIAHYYLYKCSNYNLNNTAYNDMKRAFLGFMSLDKRADEYSMQEVIACAKDFHNQSQDTISEHYLSQDERKEMTQQYAKQKQQQYLEEHKEEIEQRKLDYKQKQKEYYNQYKAKQKEWLKQNKKH